MSTNETHAVWRGAELAILPVIRELFREGDVVRGEEETFRFAGVRSYDDAASAASTAQVIVLDATSGGDAAHLLPAAIGPVLHQMQTHPERFREAATLAHAVQEVWADAGLERADLPEAERHVAQYVALCRELLDRLSPGIRRDAQGVAWIRGTQVKVIEVAASQIAHGWSAEEIRRQHPGLDLASIHAALAWYHRHKTECDVALDADLLRAEAMHAAQGESALRAKLRRAKLVA